MASVRLYFNSIKRLFSKNQSSMEDVVRGCDFAIALSVLSILLKCIPLLRLLKF